MNTSPRLPLSLIPLTALQNARTVLTPEQWRAAARQTYARSGHRCEACATPYPSGSSLGSGGWEAHETWLFEEGGVQKLVALRNLCQRCHKTTHLSFTRSRSGSDAVAAAALAHLARVNGWTSPAVAAEYARLELAICQARSRQTWKLDLSLLREFGIEPARARTSSPLPSGRSWWQRFLGTA